MNHPVIPSNTSPAARCAAALGRLCALAFAALTVLACGPAQTDATGAYLVTPSPDLVRSLEAIAGVEQRWALMRRSLASANATYDNMAEAWSMVLDAVSRAQPAPVDATPPNDPSSPGGDCVDRRALARDELAEVQLRLIGRRQVLSPETVELRLRERDLTQALKKLPPSASCQPGQESVPPRSNASD